MSHVRGYRRLLENPAMALPPTFLAPNLVLPVQWPSAPLVGQGVRRLHIAVLRQAVEEYHLRRRLHDGQVPQELVRWFWGQADAPISFHDACAVVGLHPDAVRRKLGLTPPSRAAA